MEAYQQRVVDEQAELADRLQKLNAFRTTPAFKALDRAEQQRMDDQSFHMSALLNILRDRIQGFAKAAAETSPSTPTAPKFDGDFTVDLPAYKSHKTVWAAKVVAIDGFRLDLMPHGTYDASVGWFNRHNPAVGGYLVVYEDGYTSWSPAEAFEGGYTKL